MRNFLTTLLLSAGVPMLRMGDELSQTQRGNNNAYCQDNDTSWLDWSADGPLPCHVDLVSRLIRLRRDHPVFRRRAFFLGRAVGDDGVKDLAWFTAEGKELDDSHWSSPSASTLGMYLSGQGIRTRGPRGERITDDSFMLLLHAGAEGTAFRLPGPPWATSYAVELDTAQPTGAPLSPAIDAAAEMPLVARSAVLLRACH
jgi:glycogen operon protein